MKKGEIAWKMKCEREGTGTVRELGSSYDREETIKRLIKNEVTIVGF